MCVQTAFKPTLLYVQLLIYHFTTGSQTFSNELQHYGVTESLLQEAYYQCTEEKIDLY